MTENVDMNLPHSNLDCSQEKFTSVVKRKRVRPDVVMIMTTGKLGESGELQTYFDKMGVPFTFSGVEETKVII